MKVGNIYYLIPNLAPPSLNIKEDLFSNPKALLRRVWKRIKLVRIKIVGGIKIHYQHCAMLNEIGYNAFPLLMGNLDLHNFDYDGEILSLAQVGTVLNENDIVVGTEYCPYEALMFEGGKKIIFVQNWVNLAPNRRFLPEDDGKSYHELGYDYVMGCSRYIQEYVKNKMGARSYLIQNGIDLQKFSPLEEKRVTNRILYMPRKNRQDIDKIREILTSEPMEFVAADGLSESELIREYQKSDIFLASGYPEGFGLPPLEAMACGCAVVGFDGRGAAEYMIDGVTAMVAEDGDCEVAAKKLQRLVRDTKLKEEIRARGMEISRNYSLDGMKSNVREFYEFMEIEMQAEDKMCV